MVLRHPCRQAIVCSGRFYPLRSRALQQCRLHYIDSPRPPRTIYIQKCVRRARCRELAWTPCGQFPLLSWFSSRWTGSIGGSHYSHSRERSDDGVMCAPRISTLVLLPLIILTIAQGPGLEIINQGVRVLSSLCFLLLGSLRVCRWHSLFSTYRAYSVCYLSLCAGT
ncbi:hypothetical protein NEOLEDRAFT_721951 [Neolentinus lepideus HHB14362 ss-1]|uniref:Uncharacterized protein n=1 Tax=Neolentinus lepideus HHB14362 ss-1 TaxID=1314782 RepID=A0A165Q2F4_9AGAM|nr:hypothetical protein NEOLEDRAFT_721951 [Neolentinus lepideus HHB14362 ss-1]